MKNFKIESANLKRSLHILAVVILSITYYMLLTNLDVVSGKVSGFFGALRSILLPFIFGFFIAYLINPLIRFFENLILKLKFNKIKFKKPKPKLPRFLAAFFSFALIFGTLIWIVSYIFPEISQSVTNMFQTISGLSSVSQNKYVTDAIIWINETFGENYTYREIMDMVLGPVMQLTQNLPSLAGMVLTGTFNAASVALNFVLGIMIAFYMILEKESFAKFSVKLLKISLKEKTAERIIDVAKKSNNMFERFFTGKIIDSIIIGWMFYIGARVIFDLKFVLIFSLIIGVTNVIPYFGPFIGGIPVAFLVFLGDPRQGILVGVFIFALQQFDGIILGPKILGDSTGLRPIDVIFAIIIGGALFGVLGMFLGVPVFAVIKAMFGAFIDARYEKKYLLGSGSIKDVEHDETL
ncbi:MAG: AI-2E family transporter [Clostridiales bacterium]|jgi:predicted PurR-regulated permease PerM|nr:AI-2E family transporter [Clostridiales bacterium]